MNSARTDALQLRPVPCSLRHADVFLTLLIQFDGSGRTFPSNVHEGTMKMLVIGSLISSSGRRRSSESQLHPLMDKNRPRLPEAEGRSDQKHFCPI